MAIIFLKEVRLSFAQNIYTPGRPPSDPNAKLKYGAQFIIEPGSENHKALERVMREQASGKFGANWEAIYNSIDGNKKCLRDGNKNLDGSGNVRAGYAGKLFVKANNAQAPVIVDQFGQPLTQASGKPYSGCWVNVKLDIYAQNKPGQGAQVNASLLAIQFAKDGDAFGGVPPSADGFEFATPGTSNDTDAFFA